MAGRGIAAPMGSESARSGKPRRWGGNLRWSRESTGDRPAATLCVTDGGCVYLSASPIASVATETGLPMLVHENLMRPGDAITRESRRRESFSLAISLSGHGSSSRCGCAPCSLVRNCCFRAVWRSGDRCDTAVESGRGRSRNFYSSWNERLRQSRRLESLEAGVKFESREAGGARRRFRPFGFGGGDGQDE